MSASKNEIVASIFYGLGVFRELEGESFRATAYYDASQAIAALTEDSIENVYRDMEGIGKSLALKIEEIVKSGKCKAFEQYRKKYPGLIELTALPGIGPKTAFKLWKEHKVRSLKGLQQAIKRGKINMPKVAKALESHFNGGETDRMPRALALDAVAPILAMIQAWPFVRKAEFAGSMRRERETVGDVDIVVATKKPKKTHKAFIAYFKKKNAGVTILAAGDTKSRVLLQVTGKRALQVDLLTVPPSQYGAALMYFTGSKAHNILLRKVAISKGWKLNEYGLFNKKGERLDKPSLREEHIYKMLGVPYHPPIARDKDRLMHD